MPYQSRNRDYLTRREKNARTRRHFKTFLFFLLLAAIVWIIKDWEDISFYVKTYWRG
jgi:hypothetical protein